MEKVLKYTENEVNFDSVKIPQILYEHGPLGRKGKIEYNDDEVTHIDDKPFINAVDIDWNGIEVENNNRINTTADLINWIKSRSTGSSGGSQPETISIPITCYRWYHIQDTPNVPTENSEEPAKNDTYEAIPESKWSKYALNRPEGNNWVLYLCSGTKEGKSYSWRSVTRISGIDGSIGEDSKDREWIYKVFNEEQTFSFDNYNPNNWNTVQQDDYVGPNGFQWSDNPQGVSKENKFEYASYRDYKNKQWTRFSTPILWSHYGVNGIDGDGVEYCYVRTVSKEAPEVVVNNIENELTDEYKPLVKIESLAGYNNTKQDIKGEGEYYQDGGYSYTHCTDDPKGVDGIFQYEWVIVRKKDEPNDNGTRKWKRYSGQMSLWSSFTVNIDHAITIKDGFLWGDGDYIRDGDGNPIQIEGGDGSQGVETIGCPEEDKTYKPGTISVCENKVKIYYNDQWIDFGEGSGSGKYIHVAYAKTIDFVNKKYTGFSTTNSNNGIIYDWMGIMFDDSIDDPKNIDRDNTNDPDGSKWYAFMQYKWNYIKGRDGNGVEYIFLLTKEEVTNPGINQESYEVEGVTHNKQDDEFLPKVKDYNLNNTNYQSEYWTDDPQQGVSENWPKLWKAIRKKVNGVWQSFGPPKIENQYFAQTSIYVITSDNDNILLDDQSTDRDIISVAAAGNLELKYGTQTIDDAWYDVVDDDHNLPNHLVPKIKNRNSFNLEYDTGYTAPDKFNTGQYHFTIRAKLTNDSSAPYVAQKQFNVIIKDISVDGSFYKLVIENDSQSYDGNKNSYNNNVPIVHVQKISKKDNKISISEETNINITTEIIDPENPGNPENISKGLVLYIPEGLFTTVESTTKYNSPIELNNVTYQKGGYDIVLYYYNGEKLELLGYEHIDCVKDGKDSSTSDGITIQSITRYYQAAEDDNPYPQSHENHENENDGWKSPQSEVKDWNASKPYLFIQDKTTYNNGTSSWGPVELYSYWGNENYDLVVSPQHIILDEKLVIDKETETITSRNYEGTQTVLLKLYKGSSDTNDNLIYIGFNNTNIPFNSISGESMGTATVPTEKNKSITITIGSITNPTASEGYLDFSVRGYSSSNSDTPVYVKNVRVPVYINRAESKLFSYKGELKDYIDDQDKVIVKNYNASIEATQKKLRSEYTESIRKAGDYNWNLFGFHKGVEFGRFVPFIQSYGIAIPKSLWITDNGKYYGYIKNLGFDGVGGLFTINFKARTSSQDNESVEFIFWTSKKCSNTNTVDINDSWKEYTLEYNLDLDVADVTDTNGKNSIPKGELQIRTRNNNFDLYIRELKIERGNIKTDFCEAAEDLGYFDDKQLISNLSFNSDYISYSSNTEVETKTGVYYTRNAIVASSFTDDFVDLLYQNNSFNIEAGCVYTLSYWAKFSNTNEAYITSYLYDSVNNLIPDVANNIYIPGNSGSIIAGVKSDGETFVRLSNEWKHYFIRFYATNSINNASLIVARYVKKKFNSNVSLNGSGQLYIYDIKFQEGYAVEPKYYKSLIEQTARGISLLQQTGLKKAGIDIYNGKVDVQADQFTIRNSSGQENMSVNENGDVEFRGVIKGTYNFKVQTYDTSNSSISNTIDLDTDYFMFPGTNGSYSATLQDPRLCPGRVINVIKNNRPTQNKVLLQNYDSEIPFIWYDNTEQPSKGPIDFYYYQKVVVWSDPELLAKTVWGWRVIDSIKY